MKNNPLYLLIFSLLFIGTIANAQSTIQTEKHSKIELSLGQQEGLLQELAAQGLAVDHFMKTGPNTIELILSESELAVLESMQFDYQIMIQDMEAHYESILQAPANRVVGGCGLDNFDGGNMGGYHTYDEVMTHINNMQVEFPDIVKTMQIGSSIEGRAIMAVKISDNVEADESAEEGVVYFDALHHAREPMSMESVLYYMWWLLENYDNEAEASYLVDHREMYFVPVVNPDGYVYNQQTNPNGGGLWRKNRRDAGNGCFGIDLNRNYPFGWGLDSGSSNDPCTNTYRGTEPFSEPETAAVRDLVTDIKPAIAFTCHTYGDKFLSPFGFTDSLATYEVYAEFASEFIPPTYAGYGTTAKMLNYTSSGTTRDYLHTEGTYAWTPEIGHSFWEPASVICNRVQEFLPTMQYLSWVGGDFACFYNFETLNEQIWQEDTIELNLRIKNRGLTFPSVDVVVKVESLQGSIVPIRNSISYGAIGPRAFQDNGNEPFTFYVEGEIEVGELLAFELVVTQDGHESYRDLIYLTAGLRTELYSDDFENGSENWFSAPPAWDTTFMDSQSGLRCLADSRYGNYPANANASIVLIDGIDLSGANYPQVEFNAKWSMEEDYDYVVISANDGSGPEPLEGLHSIPVNGQPAYIYNQHWVQEFINLQSFIGASDVSFRFNLRADGGVHSDGFYLDDFKVVDYSEPLMVGTDNPGLENFQLSVFPNPGRGEVGLNIDSPLAGIGELTLFSSSGQLVFQKELILAQGHTLHALVLSGLVPGIYHLKLSTAVGVQVVQVAVY